LGFARQILRECRAADRDGVSDDVVFPSVALGVEKLTESFAELHVPSFRRVVLLVLSGRRQFDSHRDKIL
jgi:hypothetical protein